jgi:hypothetical protein
MNRWTIGMVVTILAGTTAVCLAIQRRAAVSLRERAESAQKQAEAIANATTDNQRLSGLVENLGNTAPLSRPEILELAKLRNQVRVNRELVAAKVGIDTTNAKLRQVAADCQRKLAEAQAAPNYWPKDQLSFAGLSTPEATMQSLLWSAQTGNLNSWESLCTTGAVAEMTAEWQRHGLTPDQQQDELQTMGRALTSASAGFHIVNERNPAPDETDIDLSFDGEDAVRTFVLNRVGSDWKFDKVLQKDEAEQGR